MGVKVREKRGKLYLDICVSPRYAVPNERYNCLRAHRSTQFFSGETVFKQGKGIKII